MAARWEQSEWKCDDPKPRGSYYCCPSGWTYDPVGFQVYIGSRGYTIARTCTEDPNLVACGPSPGPGYVCCSTVRQWVKDVGQNSCPLVKADGSYDGDFVKSLNLQTTSQSRRNLALPVGVALLLAGSFFGFKLIFSG